MIKKFLTTDHRWLRFPVGLLFIITFSTGFITAIDELSVRIDHAQKSSGYSLQQTTISDNADVLSKITSGKKGYQAD